MLTYRTGAAGSGRGARNMAEHLLQQTLSPEMAVMADYYEQGVAPPAAAEAVAAATCATSWTDSCGLAWLWTRW